MSRKALGKGLSILYGEESQESAVGGHASKTTIPAEQISANPFQPRIDFSAEHIEELANSIKEQGLLQPIVVRRISEQKFEIISGERRFRALKSLGENDIPAIIRDKVDDKQMLELALVENIQRENLNDIELALSYKKLIDDCNYSHQQLSEKLGKGRASVTNSLRLLKLPEAIQIMIRNQQISAGHAKVLLSVENPILQLEFAQETVKKALSVRDLETKISSALNQKGKKEQENGDGGAKKESVLTDRYSSVLSEIKRLQGFELKVVEFGEDKGKVEINFADAQEFEKIIAILSKEDEYEKQN